MDKMRVQSRGRACARCRHRPGALGRRWILWILPAPAAPCSRRRGQKGERAAGKETSPANEAQGPSIPAAPACVAQQRVDYGDPTLAMHPHLARCSILAVWRAQTSTSTHLCAWWWYFGRAHSKNRHQKTGACSQSASQPRACRPYLRPTKIAGPLPEPLTLQIAAIIAWSYSRLIRAISPQGEMVSFRDMFSATLLYCATVRWQSGSGQTA